MTNTGTCRGTSVRGLLLLSAATLSAFASGTISPARADEASSGQIETITVTAEKRPENVQDVPLSIVAISGDRLEARGVDNPVELVKVVPDLQVSTVAQSAGVIFRVRGFGSGSNAAIDPDVAPYLDTAYIPHPGAMISSFLDVASVEVLRGPQGTLFGRNAVMGAISITTNAPSTDEKTIEGKFEAGSYGTVSGDVIANLPVSDDFALRAAVTAAHTDGFWHNLFDSKTYGGRDTMAGRLSAKWEISPNATWVLRVDGAVMNGDGLNPAPIDTATATPAQLAHLSAVVGAFGGTPSVYSYPPRFTVNQRFVHPSLRDSQYGVTSDVSWTASPDVTLRLIDTYRSWNDAQTDGDVVFTTLDLLNRHQTFGSKSQSHELQLVTPKGAFLDSRVGFTAGLYYFSENYDLEEVLDLGSQYCTLAFFAHPAFIAPCNAAPHAGATRAPFSQHAQSFAAYSQVNIQILPDLELDLGARQTWDRKSGNFQQIVLNPFAGANVVRAPEGPDAMTFSDSKPSWLADLSWHLSDDVMLFATYATGYKSGGFNSAPGAVALTPATRSFSSETSDDFEVGMKSVFWDNRVLLNTTLFNTQLHNFQDRSFNGLSFVIRNSGNVRSRGIETEGEIHAVDHLNLTFGVARLDSIYTRNLTAPQYDGCSAAVVNAACPGFQDLSGRVLPFAAKWQGNVGLEANSDPFMGGFTGTFAVSENFTSSYQAENTDSPQTTIPGYGTTDARLSFVSPDTRWQLDLFASNIFDKHYYTIFFPQPLAGALGLNNTTTGDTVFRGFMGDPRTLGVRVSAKF